MGRTSEFIRYWGQLFLKPVLWISYLYRRDKKTWLFGSTFGSRFSDSPRYFYLYVSQNHSDDINAIWISAQPEIVDLLTKNGLKAYLRDSREGRYYIKHAGAYFYDNYVKDIDFWHSGGALHFNMWHGVPLKKIQHDNRFDRFRNPKGFLQWLNGVPRRLTDEKKHDYILATSEFYAPVFSGAFKTKKVIVNGYPRCDMLKELENGKTGIKNILSIEEQRVYDIISECSRKGMKIIFYMPTFRETETMFLDIMNLDKFSSYLKENNALFVVKLHCKSKLAKALDDKNFESIVQMKQGSDPYSCLKFSDVLVTDYSSIYFDYLLTGKPIVFFDYDKKEYLASSRELYFDYDEFTPGQKAENQDELEKALSDCIFHNAGNHSYENKYADMRKNILEKAFGCYEKEMFSEKLYRKLCLLMDIKK
jgi:CDP-glycerol glycerophosphotransferase (TagB/SpsB family)